MTLGERIRQQRLRLGITQSELASGVVTRNMLSQIEHDAASPSVRTLESLASRLGVTAGWLLSGGEDTLAPARTALADGDAARAAEYAEPAPDSPERNLILTKAYLSLAREAVEDGRLKRAEKQAKRSLACRDALYADSEDERKALAILALCALAEGASAEEEIRAFTDAGDRVGIETEHHLLLARYHLSQEHLTAAERDIWTILHLAAEQKGRYLLLRGRLALKQEKYGAAAAFLHQAEDAGVPPLHRRELYESLAAALDALDEREEARNYAALAKRTQFPSETED